MSSNERHGSSDAGADQGLAAHWAIVSLTIFGVVVISCYSQYKCHALERRGIRLRAVATALQTSLVLVLWYLFPLMSLVQGAANAGINCFWYVFWPHLCIGGVIGIHAHRILTFTYNLAQNERTKNYLRFGTANPAKLRYIEKHDFAALEYSKKVLRYLNPTIINVVSLVLFSVAAGPLMFIIPDNLQAFQGDDGVECWATTSGITILVWFLWVIPFLWFLNKYRVEDPYRIKQKLKIESISATITFIVFLLFIPLEDIIGSAHHALLTFQVLVCMEIAVWYCESWVTLKNTLQWLRVKDEPGSLKLQDTLTNPNLLLLFEEHLIKEWATENLRFYKASVKYRVEADRQIRKVEKSLRKRDREPPAKESSSNDVRINISAKDSSDAQNSPENKMNKLLELLTLKAYRVYMEYVSHESHNQVNISEPVRANIDRFFAMPMIDDIVANATHNNTYGGTAGASTVMEYGVLEVSKKIENKEQRRESVSQGSEMRPGEIKRPMSPISLSQPTLVNASGKSSQKRSPNGSPIRNHQNEKTESKSPVAARNAASASPGATTEGTASTVTNSSNTNSTNNSKNPLNGVGTSRSSMRTPRTYRPSRQGTAESKTLMLGTGFAQSSSSRVPTGLNLTMSTLRNQELPSEGQIPPPSGLPKKGSPRSRGSQAVFFTPKTGATIPRNAWRIKKAIQFCHVLKEYASIFLKDDDKSPTNSQQKPINSNTTATPAGPPSSSRPLVTGGRHSSDGSGMLGMSRSGRSAELKNELSVVEAVNTVVGIFDMANRAAYVLMQEDSHRRFRVQNAHVIHTVKRRQVPQANDNTNAKLDESVDRDSLN